MKQPVDKRIPILHNISMQQKKLYLIIAAVIIVLLGGAGGYYLMAQKQQEAPAAQNQGPQVYVLSPDAIGLVIAFRDDKKAMKFTINNTKDITAVEYTIAYTANQKGQDVQQGLIGELIPDKSQSSWSTNYREFGTCSSGVCRYDTVVSPVTLTLKVTKTDGKVYQVVKTVTIPQ